MICKAAMHEELVASVKLREARKEYRRLVAMLEVIIAAARAGGCDVEVTPKRLMEGLLLDQQ